MDLCLSDKMQHIKYTRLCTSPYGPVKSVFKKNNVVLKTLELFAGPGFES